MARGAGNDAAGGDHEGDRRGAAVDTGGGLIADYAQANQYLEEVFIPDFNRRFAVKPAQKESAFTKLPGLELDLLLSSHYRRIVRNDNTVTFNNLILQLPTTRQRPHFVRCPVIVHQFTNGTLGVGYQGRLLARYDSLGAPLPAQPNKVRPARAQRWAGQYWPAGDAAAPLPERFQNQHFSARTPFSNQSADGKILELPSNPIPEVL